MVKNYTPWEEGHAEHFEVIKGLNMKEEVYLLHPSKTGTNHFLKQREVNIIKKKNLSAGAIV